MNRLRICYNHFEMNNTIRTDNQLAINDKEELFQGEYCKLYDSSIIRIPDSKT